MTGEKLTSNDKRLILFIVLVAAAAVVYIRSNYFAAFPEASIDLRYSKQQITQKAEAFLQGRGLSTAGFRNLTLFDPDETARTYLEREMGLEQANRLMQDKVAVWRWRARWFHPPEKEEMLVFLSPAGRLTGFEHVIPEAAAGARLDKEAARRLASQFLEQQTRAPQRLVEDQLQERPNRYDYLFTWEEEGFRAKDATYRRTIVVQGDRIGRYSEYLHVPEQWKRDFAELRSSNELYSQIAQAFALLLALAAIAVLIRSFRRGLLQWRPLLLIACTVGGLMVVNEWNSIPFFIDGMPTSSPYSQSLIFALLSGLGAGVGIFFYVILAAAAGEPLYRQSQPEKLSLLAVPTRAGIRTKEFFLAAVVGYGFAAVHIAFVVAFYLIGRRFGVWSPQDVNYSDLLSTWLPWIYPLTIAVLAATSEEFWFRLFAIPLLKRYLRSTWIAVLIPAFIWGFLHANYPQQPGYIRGIEVGVVGVAAGFLMLRFGILATLIWHYAVDAVMIGTFLIRSKSLYFQLSGWLVAFAVLFPLLASLGFYWKHGGFLADSGIRNAGAEPAPPVPERREAEPAGESLAPTWPLKWLYGAAVAAGAIGLLVHTTPFGAFIRAKMSRPGAETTASRVLKDRVPDLSSWKVAGDFVPNLESADFEYVRRHGGVRKANEVVRDYTAAGLWRVRFFKPLQKEEWRVLLDREGRVYSVDHLLDEKARGANLTAQQAQEIARNYLEQRQKLSPDAYRLVDSTSDKKENRTDYTFVWEDSSFHLAEAKARASLDVQGDEPSHFRRFLKLPEEWLREFEKPRLARIAIPGAIGAAGLLLLVIFVKRLGARTANGESAHRYHWRTYLAVAGSGVLLGVFSSLNRWPEMLSSYDTAEPFQSHVIQFILGRLMLILLVGLALFLVVLAADVFLQLATGNRQLRRASFGRAAGVFVLVWGVARILTVVYQYIPGPRLSLPLWSLPGIETYAPAVAVLSTAFVSAVLVLCAAVVVVSAAHQYLNARTQGAMAAVAGLIYAVSRAQNLPQFVYSFLLILFWIGMLLVLVRVCATDLVTFGVALFWLYACGPAADLIQQPAGWVRGNGIAAVCLALAAGIFLILRFRQGNGNEALTPPPLP